MGEGGDLARDVEIGGDGLEGDDDHQRRAVDDGQDGEDRPGDAPGGGRFDGVHPAASWRFPRRCPLGGSRATWLE
jgi:hypothetical protein